MATESTIESVAKVAPSAGIGGLSLLSIPINEWVLVCTLVYTVLIILDKLFPGCVAKAAAWATSWLRSNHE